ncbi:MAG: glycoside hydrolase family 28 protein, partial [Bacteroidales bacterium]|nr:glycoside hydrolase family 28 protein [Bacteroidales bacterium]
LKVRSPKLPGGVSVAELRIGTVSGSFAVRTADEKTGWERVPDILARIVPPEFPDRDFNIMDFGADNDGETLCTKAFRKAVEACNEAGGGRVVVPAGVFLTGPIHLKSNVNLHVSEGATVKFSLDTADYLPAVLTRFEGTECYSYSPLIYAFEQENIAITGQGTLDGQASFENWWGMIRRARQDIQNLRTMAEEEIPVEERIFGGGHNIRPLMIQPYRCKNILIDSVTIKNSPFWHIHPVLSTNFTLSNVTIIGHGPNNDGCNPESCEDILIENTYFDTGDDCIAIKSGRNADGRRINVPTRNMIVRGCTMKDGHGGVVIGSEITGGANNIFAEDCEMDSPNLDRALRIKTNSIRGGLIEDIYVRNIRVGQVADAAIRVNFLYGEGDVAEFVPVVRNVEVRNMTCEKSRYAIRFDGYDRSPISDFRIIDCSFQDIARPNHLVGFENLCLDNVVIGDSVFHKILNPSDGEKFNNQ